MRKLALITGCARGIGREIALELARDGYNIIGTYNTSIDEIKLLKSRIESIGVNFEFFKLDLSKEEEINNLYDKVKCKYKKIDLLINNAALCLDNEFELKTKDEFMKILEVNLVGPFLIIQKFKDLLENGTILNISSTDGINTFSKLNIDYSASKAGLINLTKSLSLVLDNINIYCLCPNWVNTESIKEMNQDYLRDELKRINQKKLIEPKEVAKKVVNILESNLKSGSIVVMEDSYDK